MSQDNEPKHFKPPYKPLDSQYSQPDHAGGELDQHHNRIQHPHRPAADLSQFWVVTVISNPVRYKRRYELYWRFKEMCESARVNLITVEQAFGNRPFMVTRADNPMHLQVRTVEELWHKENMVNLGVKHACAIAPGRVREVAWVDADCRPAMMPREWFEETWHALQHYEFVQMWEYLMDLDVNHNSIGGPQPGFMANYIKYGTPTPEEFWAIQEGKLGRHVHHHHDHPHRHHHHKHHHHKHHHHHHHHHNPPPYPYDEAGPTIFGRPGLAWAANLETGFNRVGGLIDFSILGAGDWYMAHALVGSMTRIVGPHLGSQRYCDRLLEWQKKCERWIKRDVGYVQGLVYHDFHGKKLNRGYKTRGQILFENQYDPETDIKYDAHGMLQLETWDDRQIKLRDGIRGYFRSRNEDSIDL